LCLRIYLSSVEEEPMSDPGAQLAAIERNVVRRQVANEDGIGVVLRRQFAAPLAEVWAALTEPERVK
jgi:hypothetical protein